MKLSNYLRRYLDRNRPASRQVEVREDDIFIVSYPKSGNTWMRFLLANLLNSGTDVGFDNIETLAPDIYAHPNRRLNLMMGPRLLKSHEYFDPRYRNVIYIVRDPRDVAVSYWNHHIKFGIISSSDSKSDFIDRYIAGELDPFGTWAEHVGGWLGAREMDKHFLLIHYEDMLSDPLSGAERIARHLSLPLTHEEVIAAMESSSFKKMKHDEQRQGKLWLPIQNTSSDLPFVRKGLAQQWKDDLDPHLVDRITDRFRPQMQRLGYLDD